MTARAPRPDPDTRALGLHQPWAELILRGIKTIEVRRVPTRVRGRIYLYAGKHFSPWDFANDAAERYQLQRPVLPRGRIVGSVEILDCRPSAPEDAVKACVPSAELAGAYSWLLSRPERFAEPWEVPRPPFGTWYYPFRPLPQRTVGRRGHGGV
jgi:hypothetical protein